MLRLERIRARNMGVLRDVDVDLTAIEGQLVAVVGPNGAGKSTLLELAAGALYRKCPSRGTLAELARERDSYVEVRVQNGQTWTIRQSHDAVSGKGESLVLDAAGAPAFASAKRRSHDEWAAKHLPAASVFYATVFASQGSTGFIDLDPGDAKGVLLRALQVERLEVLAEFARVEARGAATATDVARARVDDESARAVALDVAEKDHDDARAALLKADMAALDARGASDTARTAAVAWDAAADARRAFALERERIAHDVAALETKIADARVRIANNRAALDHRDEILAAEASLGELRARAEGAAAEAERAAKDEQSAASAAADICERGKGQDARARRLAELSVQAQRGSAGAEEVERAAAELPGLEAALAAARDALRATDEDLDRIAGARAARADDRIDALRAAHQHIVDGAERPRDEASAALRDDDAAVRRAAELPAELARARAAQAGARRDVDSATHRVDVARRTAARAEAIAAARQQALALDAEMDEAARAADALAAEEGAARELKVERAALAQRARADADVAARALADATARAKTANQVRAAEGRIAELERDVAGTEGELVQVRARLGDLPADRDPGRRPDAAGAEAEAARLTGIARAAETAVARARDRLDVARAAELRIGELRAALAAAEGELADWTKLAADLGRDGLQAAECDAAIPELVELTNDLLHRCVTTRWTVSIETAFASKDGKRQLEGLRVNVFDAETSTGGAAARLSGGERVIVGEALSLALTMVAARRSGMRGCTLIRDETSAALDATNAVAYISMLRRAAELISADKILFVAHAPLLHDLADARLVCANGTVRVA